MVSGLFIGDFTKTTNFNFNPKYNNLLGNMTILSLIPFYFIFSNIVLFNKKKPLYATSAGTFLFIIKKIEDINLFLIKLPTGSRKYILGNTTILVGRNSNYLNKFIRIGKAGININKGYKPIVRGIAMNPVDHPHGGRTKTNQPEMSPWG
jgi:large subunit ribosomal protein L2